MVTAVYLIVSKICNAESEVAGYRVVNTSTNSVYDVEREQLLSEVLNKPTQFINVSCDFTGSKLHFGTVERHKLPRLTLSGRRLMGEDMLTVGYSDERGNLIAYNAHGVRCVIQSRDYLQGLYTFTNASLVGRKIVGYFNVYKMSDKYFKGIGEEKPVLLGNVMDSMALVI